MNLQTQTKSINSKALFNKINEKVRDGFFTAETINWKNDEDRSLFVEFLNSLMHEFWAEGVIVQWKVQCNALNNTTEDMIDGKFILDIYYKQKHCLNTSRITYTVLE